MSVGFSSGEDEVDLEGLRRRLQKMKDQNLRQFETAVLPQLIYRLRRIIRPSVVYSMFVIDRIFARIRLIVRIKCLCRKLAKRRTAAIAGTKIQNWFLPRVPTSQACCRIEAAVWPTELDLMFQGIGLRFDAIFLRRATMINTITTNNTPATMRIVVGSMEATPPRNMRKTSGYSLCCILPNSTQRATEKEGERLRAARSR